jgi:hypothetical protein
MTSISVTCTSPLCSRNEWWRRINVRSLCPADIILLCIYYKHDSTRFNNNKYYNIKILIDTIWLPCKFCTSKNIRFMNDVMHQHFCITVRKSTYCFYVWNIFCYYFTQQFWNARLRTFVLPYTRLQTYHLGEPKPFPFYFL